MKYILKQRGGNPKNTLVETHDFANEKSTLLNANDDDNLNHYIFTEESGFYGASSYIKKYKYLLTTGYLGAYGGGDKNEIMLPLWIKSISFNGNNVGNIFSRKITKSNDLSDYSIKTYINISRAPTKTATWFAHWLVYDKEPSYDDWDAYNVKNPLIGCFNSYNFKPSEPENTISFNQMKEGQYLLHSPNAIESQISKFEIDDSGGVGTMIIIDREQKKVDITILLVLPKHLNDLKIPKETSWADIRNMYFKDNHILQDLHDLHDRATVNIATVFDLMYFFDKDSNPIESQDISISSSPVNCISDTSQKYSYFHIDHTDLSRILEFNPEMIQHNCNDVYSFQKDM